MENKNKGGAWRLPDTITGWVLLLFGALALFGGLMGIAGYSAFTLISVSAVNNGILHFIGAFRRWTIFPYYVIVSRIFMGMGLLRLAVSEVESAQFTAGAIFEFAGVLILIVSLLIDSRRKRVKKNVYKTARTKT